MPTLARTHFFQKQVHMKEWKDSMSGKNEDFAIEFLGKILDYECGRDFVRQHPIGEKFVIDFAFINEQVAIEIDGDSHNEKKQRELDIKRDKYLARNNWIPIRIKEKDLQNKFKARFYKNLIRDVVEERREQWRVGTLYEIDIPNFNEADYE